MYIFGGGGSKYLYFLVRKLGRWLWETRGLGSFATSLHRSSFFEYKDSAVYLLPCGCKVWTDQMCYVYVQVMCTIFLHKIWTC